MYRRRRKRTAAQRMMMMERKNKKGRKLIRSRNRRKGIRRIAKIRVTR